MKKVLIGFSTRKGETESIANLIAEGIRFSGIEVVVKDVKELESEKDLKGYDGIVFGAPTYHGEMTQKMKTLLFLAEKTGLNKIVGGAFGAYGWSGEAPERIFDTMKHILDMDMVKAPLMLKASNIEGGIKMAQEYGKEVAQKISES